LAVAIDPSQREVVGRQLRVQTEARRFDVGRTGLRGGATRADGAVNPSPHVSLVRHLDRQDEVVAGLVE
jgi:hypothetical protein